MRSNDTSATNLIELDLDWIGSHDLRSSLWALEDVAYELEFLLTATAYFIGYHFFTNHSIQPSVSGQVYFWYAHEVASCGVVSGALTAKPVVTNTLVEEPCSTGTDACSMPSLGVRGDVTSDNCFQFCCPTRMDEPNGGWRPHHWEISVGRSRNYD